MAAPEVAPARMLLLEAVDRVIAASDGLDATATNWRPVPETSSLSALALHIMGVAEQSTLTYLCGVRETVRDRDLEFAERTEDGASLAARWTALRPELDSALDALPATALAEQRTHHTFGVVTGRELLDRLTTHAFEHAGHAEMTRQLWNARTER